MQTFQDVLYKNNNNVTVMIESFTISQMIWALNEVTPDGFSFGLSGDGTLTIDSNDIVTKTNITLDLSVPYIRNFSEDVKELFQNLFIDYCKRFYPEIKIYTLA